MNGVATSTQQPLSASRKARVLSLAARRPMKGSPNRHRLIARATVWSLGLTGMMIFLPLMLH